MACAPGDAVLSMEQVENAHHTTVRTVYAWAYSTCYRGHYLRWLASYDTLAR
jgi:hypothetical protein